MITIAWERARAEESTVRELSQKTISFSPSQSMSQLVIVKVVRHKHTYTQRLLCVVLRQNKNICSILRACEWEGCVLDKEKTLLESRFHGNLLACVCVSFSQFLARTFHNSNSIIWLSNTCLFSIRGGKIRVNPLCLDIFTSNPRDVLLD